MMKSESKIGSVTNAGQPTDDELRALKGKGYSLVINARLPEEQADDPEQPKVEALGLRYVNVPYKGDTLNAGHIRQIREAIQSAPPGEVLIH